MDRANRQLRQRGRHVLGRIRLFQPVADENQQGVVILGWVVGRALADSCRDGIRNRLVRIGGSDPAEFRG
jgi:hypothetical protein